MANSYLQFSMSFPLKTNAEKAWCTKTMTALTTLLSGDLDLDSDDAADEARNTVAAELGGLGQRVLDEEWSYLDFQWSIDPADPKTPGSLASMWLYAEESGDPDQVAAFLQAYLQKFDPQGALCFSWACTCSKMRVNEFSGGAAVVTATGTKFLDAASWAEDLAAKATTQPQLEPGGEP